MIDNKNLILAIVLSVAILFGFEYYFKLTRPAPPPEQQTAGQTQPGQQAGQAPAAPASGQAGA